MYKKKVKNNYYCILTLVHSKIKPHRAVQLSTEFVSISLVLKWVVGANRLIITS